MHQILEVSNLTAYPPLGDGLLPQEEGIQQADFAALFDCHVRLLSGDGLCSRVEAGLGH